MLTVTFGESTMSRTEVQLWYNRFKEAREDVNDDARPGRPSTPTIYVNIEAVKKMFLDNRQITIRKVADGIGISFGSCQAHRSGDVDDVQWRFRFAQKGHNCWRIMGVFLWYWNQSPIILSCYDWGDKIKIETGALDDTKKRLSEEFRGLEKTLS